MPTLSRPRRGSLQIYPRKRIYRRIPRVNWAPVSGEKGFLGFIVYKAGMVSAVVKDNTEKTTTSKKNVFMPVTILEAPNMKIFSVRFYKNKKVTKEIVVSNDKELKRKVKVPKTLKEFDKQVPAEYDDIRAIVYSLAKQTDVKKTPDMIELAIAADNKLDYVKQFLNKEITLSDSINYKLVDARGVTKGKGNQGPVARFGVALKQHKSEKGRRRPGSLSPWHPARVTFRTPQAGQLGLFTRITYNLHVLGTGNVSEKDINPSSGFRHYGKIKSSYIILKGSVQGPQKRQILLTPAFRPSYAQTKQKYELVEVMAQ